MQNKVEYRLDRVRVHLSRLWTDTQVHKKGLLWWKCQLQKALVDRSTSAPVTSMDRHTSTKMQLRWRCQKLNLGLTKYKCTCHVYGQTHKYEMQLWWRCQKLNLGWTKYKCTCHVYGQTHKYRKINSNTVKGEVCAQTEKLDLVVQKKRYECTCHVYGQTHKYKTN